MKKFFGLTLGVLILAGSALAQERVIPKRKFRPAIPICALGFSGGVNQQGGSVSIAGNLSPWFGIAGDFGGYHAAGLNTFTFLAGPRFTARNDSGSNSLCASPVGRSACYSLGRRVLRSRDPVCHKHGRRLRPADGARRRSASPGGLHCYALQRLNREYDTCLCGHRFPIGRKIMEKMTLARCRRRFVTQRCTAETVRASHRLGCDTLRG